MNMEKSFDKKWKQIPLSSRMFIWMFPKKVCRIFYKFGILDQLKKVKI